MGRGAAVFRLVAVRGGKVHSRKTRDAQTGASRVFLCLFIYESGYTILQLNVHS